MTRIGRLTVFLLLTLMFAACGGDGSSGDDQAARSAIPEKSDDSAPAATTETQGRPAIPPERPEAVEGLLIAPFFDAEGTSTEMAVAPNEVFSVYICIQHPGYDMTTAQWRMEVPEGITVLGEKKGVRSGVVHRHARGNVHHYLSVSDRRQDYQPARVQVALQQRIFRAATL